MGEIARQVALDPREVMEVLALAVALVEAKSPRELTTLLGWADHISKGRFHVRANADTGDDALVARSLGAKGIGESGTIGATPAVQSAVIDAVSHLGVRHIEMPCNGQRVWEAINEAAAR